MRSTTKSLALIAFIGLLGVAFLGGCSATTTLKSSPSTPSTPASTSVTVSPASANIRAGDSFQFTATVSGNSNTAVTWAVNGAAGGSVALGTISSTGNYSAPSSLPSPNTLTITATSVDSSAATASSAVTLLNPTPALSGTNPASVGTGNFSLTITGSNFVWALKCFSPPRRSLQLSSRVRSSPPRAPNPQPGSLVSRW